jgi:hypothetical protein
MERKEFLQGRFAHSMYNIKMDWICLVHDRDQRRAVVNTTVAYGSKKGKKRYS